MSKIRRNPPAVQVELQDSLRNINEKYSKIDQMLKNMVTKANKEVAKRFKDSDNVGLISANSKNFWRFIDNTNHCLSDVLTLIVDEYQLDSPENSEEDFPSVPDIQLPKHSSSPKCSNSFSTDNLADEINSIQDFAFSDRCTSSRKSSLNSGGVSGPSEEETRRLRVLAQKTIDVAAPTELKPKAEFTQFPVENLIANVTEGTVKSPVDFWVNLNKSNKGETLENIMRYYKVEYDKLDKLTYADIKVGEFVVACFSEDNRWYRAQVVEKNMKKTIAPIRIRYVDFGNEEWLPAIKIKEMKPEFMTEPFLGYHCELDSVKPPNGEEWTAGELDMFRFTLKDSVVHFTIIGVNEETGKYRISIKASEAPGMNRQHFLRHLVTKKIVLLTRSPNPSEYGASGSNGDASQNSGSSGHGKQTTATTTTTASHPVRSAHSRGLGYEYKGHGDHLLK